MATLTVEINPKNSVDIMKAIRLIKGVKKVRANEDDIETPEDYDAWVRARTELRQGKSISHAEIKKSLGL